MATNVLSPINVEERKKLDVKAGDTVRVWQKIKEKDKFRLQAFEGLVLARKHGSEAGATFTVRKVMDGVGVEKIFPVFSPMIDKIEILRRSKVRRAKLYFVREKAAKEIRRQMRKLLTSREESTAEVAAAAAPEAAPEATAETK
ncbi:MAG: 50S ribosomal protein L19 [Patescibacteria group bacterium]